MRNKVFAVIIVGVLGALAWAQPVPGGMSGMVRPVPPERLVTALSQEMDWLRGLSIDAPGWDKALSALEGAVEKLVAADTPSLELLAQVDAALDLVIDILERTAFQRVRARLREARQGPPEWLEDYLDEATAGLGPEEAARMRATVIGLLTGIRAQLEGQIRGRLAEGGRMGPRGLRPAPFKGPEGTHQKLPPEVETWIRGYLAGATAGMGEEAAQRTREACWGAIKAGWEFHQKQLATRRDNLEHFLRLRGIAARLDLLIIKQTSQ